jgi:4-amino-4-deoxy-L-arabinose transferase-like glycosyltransferase
MDGGSGGNGRIVIVILTVSLAARLLFGFVAVGLDAPPEADAATYDQIAMNLVSQRAYIQYHDSGIWYSLRAPLLPFLLAALYSLTGHSFVASRILMIVVGSAIPVVVFALARLIYGRRVAIVAGLISAFYPFFVMFSNVMLSEAPFTLLVGLQLVLLIRFLRNGRTADVCLAGVAAGLGCLCRATLLAFIPVCAVWLVVVYRPGLIRALRSALLFVLFTSAVIAPWTIRNYLVHGTLIPVSSRGGVVLWLGNNQWATGDIVNDYYKLLPHTPDPRTTSEADIHRISQSRALEYIRTHPKRFIWLGLRRLFHFWRPTTLMTPGTVDVSAAGLMRIIGAGTYLPVLALFFAGCLMSLRGMRLFRDPRLLLLVLLIGTYTVIHAVFPAVPRYRQPLEPVMIIMASWVLVGSGRRTDHNRAKDGH